MNIDGSNVRPARDMTEAEAREELAHESEQLADGYENTASLAKTQRSRNFWLNRAAELRARARRLRESNQFSALVRQT